MVLQIFSNNNQIQAPNNHGDKRPNSHNYAAKKSDSWRLKVTSSRNGLSTDRHSSRPHRHHEPAKPIQHTESKVNASTTWAFVSSQIAGKGGVLFIIIEVFFDTICCALFKDMPGARFYSSVSTGGGKQMINGLCSLISLKGSQTVTFSQQWVAMEQLDKLQKLENIAILGLCRAAK
jgi:hypothetical protein